MQSDESYQLIKNWHKDHVLAQHHSLDQLQGFHDEVFKEVYVITLKEMILEYGTPPCEFSWFVMGSAGRCEQAVKSDQDHGIIYEEDNEETASYFLAFGKMLVSVLDSIGYPRCEGNVMSSNPLWCQPMSRWESQINRWIAEDTWESLRYLLIFIDARAVVGDEKRVLRLKEIIFRMIQKQPAVLQRLVENTKHTVKGIGLFNQFLTISSGTYTGCLDLKTTAVLPYVNAIRLLSIIEKVESTSTLARMKALGLSDRYKKIMNEHHSYFKRLLEYRLLYAAVHGDHNGRYVAIKGLEKPERHELKKIYRGVKEIQRFTETVVQGVGYNET